MNLDSCFDAMTAPPRPNAGSRSWELDTDVLVLRCRDGYGYEVDLERCLTPAAALDWVMQVASKAWASDAVLADLVRALRAVINPQSNLCPGGTARELTLEDVAALVGAHASAPGIE